jgi:hypothetical protein
MVLATDRALRCAPFEALRRRNSLGSTLSTGVLLAVVAAFTGSAAETQAQAIPEIKVDTLEAGSSARDVKKRALQGLPLAQLSQANRAVADAVLQDVSLFRRLPTIRCETDSRMYGYFLDHPDVAVSIWRAMGISGVKMTEVAGGGFACDAGDGTLGQVEVLHRSPTSNLVSCKGTFTSPLLPKPIKGSAIMHLQVQHQRDATGKNYVVHKADLFISFPSHAVDAVAKTIAPVSNKMMDRNFEEISMFVRMMDEAARIRPAWVYDIAPKLEGVAADRPQKLVTLTQTIHREGVKQVAAQPAVSAQTR